MGLLSMTPVDPAWPSSSWFRTRTTAWRHHPTSCSGARRRHPVSASGRTCAQSDAESLSPPPAPRRPCAPRSRPLTTWLLGPLIRCACSWLTRAALRGKEWRKAEAGGGEGTATKSGSCRGCFSVRKATNETGRRGRAGCSGGSRSPSGFPRRGHAPELAPVARDLRDDLVREVALVAAVAGGGAGASARAAPGAFPRAPRGAGTGEGSYRKARRGEHARGADDDGRSRRARARARGARRKPGGADR